MFPILSAQMMLLRSWYNTSCVFFSTDNSLIPTEVRKEALQLQKLVEFDDAGAEG